VGQSFTISFETRQDHFVCATSRLKGVETCPTHFIRAVVLEEMVLWHLQYVTGFVAAYEDIFRVKMNAKHTLDRKKQTALRRKQIAQAERRISELSKLFKRMYEDNVSGKLSDTGKTYRRCGTIYPQVQAVHRINGTDTSNLERFG